MRPTPMRRIVRPLLPVAFSLSLILAACSGGPGGSGGQIPHPDGNNLVLRLDYRGGMIRDFHLTGFPPFTLTGDGRVIVPGAQIDIFPPPALPAVQVRRLTEAGIQAILAEIARTGLFGESVEYRGAQNFVTDAGDTVFTLHADGEDVEVVIHGLGGLDPSGEYPGVPAAEIAAHGTLAQLSDRLTNPDGWLAADMWADAEWQPFEPEALRLLVRNADEDPPDDSGIGNALLEWPEGSDPATFGDPASGGTLQCGVVSGEEAKDWYQLLSEANQLTRFVNGDHRYQVTVRFMLPDEPLECPAEAV